ncbi:hypothetical protein Patl1_31978 [Pistacia atlantica]|uniref:Uncharacterized protein n=1 Tax=Pistacia atlantica TaxID=434234 RepID=A0ACC1AMT0_9ROSI|nr:hypothetical protein Patl1_31978 [Pistacia atlantica]
MNLLRNAIKSSLSLRTIKPSHGLPFFHRESPKCFSTETETETPASADGSSVDQFLHTPNKGAVYGKLIGPTKLTLKSDIINLLEGSKLTPDDVKVNYSWNYTPFAIMVRFPSRSAFDNAFRQIAKNGRLYRLDKVDRSFWDNVMPYDGKTVLLQGIPQNAFPDDIDNFLSGCEYDASSIQMFVRPGNQELIRMATVRFPSQTQAMNAFLRKNRGFCLNNQILMRVLV